MSTATLNLARKWRPKTFQSIVGQDIVVSMLQNSLFKNHLFPLYLFAGQKGCGKTSTARILAAAVNCAQLSAFQKNPQSQSLPCLTCSSCMRMQEGSHPDFIEIDAASHTGVDDVRVLLESCSFMPLNGSHKVYLIDEAHMLSRAAFNAFLKILEEPPAHTLFLFATTEILKIPDTVRSRAFQLHFSALASDALRSHLEKICSTESVPYQTDALALIIHETDGSARDALNILEQVRFAHNTISLEAVRSVLGIMSAESMAELFLFMVQKQPEELLQALSALKHGQRNPTRLWHLLIQVIRSLIWQAYSLNPPLDGYHLSSALCTRILSAAPAQTLHHILDHLWHQEELFLATPYKQAFLEKIYLDIAYGAHERISKSTPIPVAKQPAAKRMEIPHKQAEAPQEKAPLASSAHPAQEVPSNGWASFVSGVATLGDPVLHSIISQATVAGTDSAHSAVILRVAHASPFFIEKINETKVHWRPLLERCFPGHHTLLITAEEKTTHSPRQHSTPEQPKIVIQKPAAPVANKAFGGSNRTAFAGKRSSSIKELISPGSPLLLTDDNKGEWPYTTALQNAFPGKLEIVSSFSDD